MKSIFKKIIIFVSLIIFIITILLSIGGGIIIYSASNAFLPLKQGFPTIKIYDENNKLVSTSNNYYNYVKLKEISNNIKNAFISIEDKDFYKHHGFSTSGIIRAIKTNITNQSYTSGASTITQQYVKNMFLSNEKTIKRKVNEIAYAIELEKRYTKDQILEAYLNSILYGGNIYGIDMACKYYFNKNPIDIGISEAAYLAGLIQAPNRYNAYKNPEAANYRKNIVLLTMLNNGYITNDEYEDEINVDISTRLDSNFNSDESYISSYLDYIYNSVSLNDNINEIYTYLDTDIQYDLYKIITNKTGLFNDDNLNCAIVVLDNKTYGVKAMIGNRSSNRFVLNYASDIKMQPGSTIKPILDYAPAIEYLSYTPATIINDEEYRYSDGTLINNYDHKYKGKITLREALSDSRNVPAVKLYQEVGADNAYKFAGKLGITANDRYEANAIGGATSGYTLLSLANAYQAFANLGYYKKASGISKIKYNHKEESNNSQATLVMKPTTAWLINNILHDVFKGSSFDLNNTYLMAKTGQTNYDEKTRIKYNIPYGSTKDSLLIGYTKDLTIGIWVGYNTITENNYLDRYKKNIPRSIMKMILEKYALDNGYYDIIDGIVKKYITIDNGNVYLSNTLGYYEYFEYGTEPTGYKEKYTKI